MKTFMIISLLFLSTYQPAQAQKRFQKADTNGDGVLSREEMRRIHDARFNSTFQRIDRNGDQQISPAELKAGKERIRQRLRKHQ